MKSTQVLVLVADGSEEIEVTVVVDLLRRAGVTVVLANVQSDLAHTVVCSRGIRLNPDEPLSIEKATKFEMVVLPGGMAGAKTFEKSEEVQQLLKLFEAQGKWIAAICAAPIALHAARIGLGKRLTSHPCVQDQLSKEYAYSDDRVVVDGKLITSRGPGTSFDFALALIKVLCGEAIQTSVAAPLILSSGVVL